MVKQNGYYALMSSFNNCFNIRGELIAFNCVFSMDHLNQIVPSHDISLLFVRVSHNISHLFVRVSHNISPLFVRVSHNISLLFVRVSHNISLLFVRVSHNISLVVAGISLAQLIHGRKITLDTK